MKVFIDTEFTDFRDRDLISIGLVTEDGREFYGENYEYDKKACSQFVKEVVLPLCNFAKHGYTRAALGANVWEWLNEVAGDEKIEIIIDYRGDWELLGELFGHEKHPKIEKHPVHIETPPALLLQNHQRLAALRIDPPDVIYSEIATRAKFMYDEEFYQYFKDTGEIQHHALSDAKANLRGYKAMMKVVEEGLAGK